MLQKKGMVLVCTLWLALFMIPMGAAGADNEIQFEKEFTSFTPVFMSGHDGDLNYT